MDITAKIVDPNGFNEDIDIRDLGDHLYRIEFTPAMKGPHAISVFHKGQHVPGKLQIYLRVHLSRSRKLKI